MSAYVATLPQGLSTITGSLPSRRLLAPRSDPGVGQLLQHRHHREHGVRRLPALVAVRPAGAILGLRQVLDRQDLEDDGDARCRGRRRRCLWPPRSPPDRSARSRRGSPRPRQMTPSKRPERAKRCATSGISNAPGTQATSMSSSDTPRAVSLASAPSTSLRVIDLVEPRGDDRDPPAGTLRVTLEDVHRSPAPSRTGASGRPSSR